MRGGWTVRWYIGVRGRAVSGLAVLYSNVPHEMVSSRVRHAAHITDMTEVAVCSSLVTGEMVPSTKLAPAVAGKHSVVVLLQINISV